MTIINKLNSKRLNRKHFILYSGISLVGLYSLIKFPFKLFSKPSAYKNNDAERKSDFIIRENPDAVKRNNEIAKR